MSEFNFDEPAPKSSGLSMPSFEVWDVLSVVVLLITLCLGGYFLLIFINPDSSLNPLPPYQMSLPTATGTPIQMEATWTPTPTVYFSPTATLLPSITPPATITPPIFVPASDTPRPTNTPTFTPTPKVPYTAVSVDPIASTLFYPDTGCTWFGVGGTVNDQNGSPVYFIVIRLTGWLDGKMIEMTSVSGTENKYGESGFEFYLGDTPVASTDLSIRLFNTAGYPLSDAVSLRTYNDCEKNLILVRFKKNR